MLTSCPTRRVAVPVEASTYALAGKYPTKKNRRTHRNGEYFLPFGIHFAMDAASEVVVEGVLLYYAYAPVEAPEVFLECFSPSFCWRVLLVKLDLSGFSLRREFVNFREYGWETQG